jgi:hypothetical protein
MRVPLTYLAIFLVPAAAYWLYLQILQAQGARRDLPSTPWVWLSIAGLSLVIASFVSMGLWQQGPANGTYVPAHMEGGSLVPAETKSK